MVHYGATEAHPRQSKSSGAAKVAAAVVLGLTCALVLLLANSPAQGEEVDLIQFNGPYEWTGAGEKAAEADWAQHPMNIKVEHYEWKGTGEKSAEAETDIFNNNFWSR